MSDRHILPYPFPMNYHTGVGDVLFKLDFNQDDPDLVSKIGSIIKAWAAYPIHYAEEREYFAGCAAALYGVNLQ